jgi:hypothetical protein
MIAVSVMGEKKSQMVSQIVFFKAGEKRRAEQLNEQDIRDEDIVEQCRGLNSSLRSRRLATYLMMLALTRQSNWRMVVGVNFFGGTRVKV